MLDSRSQGEASADFRDSGYDSSNEEKLQYTIKGIEKRSVDLMRSAAKVEGMKIGAWVSRRLREAAEASLNDEEPAYSRTFFSQEMNNPRSVDLEDFVKKSEMIMDKLYKLESFMQRMHENQLALIAGLSASHTRLP
jgi:hypothetical protein